MINLQWVDTPLLVMGLVFVGSVLFLALTIFMYTRRQVMRRIQKMKFDRNRLRSIPRRGSVVVRLSEDETLEVRGDYQLHKRTPRHLRVPTKHQ